MSRFESWSRRKRGLEEDDQTLFEDMAPDLTEAEASPPSAVNEPEPSPEGVDGDAQLPDPDTLDPGSDFKAFLLPGVSPELKRRALRRMFTAENYNVRDGLDDYDQDFTKLRRLSGETTAQLRRWMDKLTESDTTSEQAQPPQSTHEEQGPHEKQHAYEDLSDAQSTQDNDTTHPTSGPV